MSNVIGIHEIFGLANGGTYCWICQKPVSTRALFCHHCGTIQPVRDIDHFARLGLARQLDVDAETLDHQYNALSRTLAPDRFAIRGMGERGHAAKQLEALNEAYDVLRDPVKRGRYWLRMNEKDQAQVDAHNPVVDELRRELGDAAEPSQYDRVAQKAGQALEQGVMVLMQSLRGGNWQLANMTLVELDGVEALLEEVRDCRTKAVQARE